MSFIARSEARGLVERLKGNSTEPFGEMLASHLAAACAYPQLAYVAGLVILDSSIEFLFIINKSTYCEFTGAEADSLRHLCRNYPWIKKSPLRNISISRGWKHYQLAKGSFATASKLNVVDPISMADGGFNTWGVRPSTVRDITGAE